MKVLRPKRQTHRLGGSGSGEENTSSAAFTTKLQPVVFVTADMVGDLDSPLYGLYDIASSLDKTA